MAEKLPLFATVGEAYRLLARHLDRIAGYAWLPALLFAAADYLLLRGVAGGGHPAVNDPAFLLAANAAGLATTIATVPLVTSTHRLIILGRRGRTGLALHREEWGYLWTGVKLLPRALLATVAAMLPAGAIVTALLAKRGPLGPLLVELVLILAILAIGALLARFQLAFPAAALGRPLAFGKSAERLKGNVLRLYGVMLVAALPFYFVHFLLGLLVELGGIPVLLLQGMASAALVVVWAIGLSLAYQRYVDNGEA